MHIDHVCLNTFIRTQSSNNCISQSQASWNACKRLLLCVTEVAIYQYLYQGSPDDGGSTQL
jgi:hypothetical protein